MKKKAIIIGGDHHNTLAIIRCLGKNKIDFKILIHSNSIGNKNQISIFYSKYVKYLDLVEESESSILNWLLNNKEKEKQIIFPASDISEYTIDKNFSQLSDFFIIPGFKNHPGKVVQMMDKFEQKKWADINNIPMAKSWVIVKKDNHFLYPTDITFPCIIKPCISAVGKKSDIHISNNIDDFKSSLLDLNDYEKLLIQEFIKKDYEVCAIGYITPDFSCGQVIRKIRENPPHGGGSLTYAKFINNKDINKTIDKVINQLKIEKYQGLYDIEFFVCQNCIYLNEINFRHSGNGYASIKSGLNAPYNLYLYFMEKEYKCQRKYKLITLIDDFNELSLLKNKYISIFIFMYDFFRANAHSVFSISDFGVFKYKIKTMILKKVKRNG